MKKVPPVLVAAAAIDLATTLFVAIVTVFRGSSYDSWMFSARYHLATSAAWMTANALWVAGLVDIARRLPRARAIGAQLAAGGLALTVAAEVILPWIQVLAPQWSKLGDLYTYTFGVLLVIKLAGLAIATWTRPVIAIVASACAFVAMPPRPVDKWLYGWLDLEGQTWWKLRETLVVVHLVAFVVLAFVAARDATPADADPGRAVAGFRRAGGALWMRVVASVAVMSITLLLVVGDAGRGAESVLKLATMSAAVIGLVSAVLFALGALGVARSNAPGVSPAFAIASAATTLWVGAVAARQLPWTYSLLYGEHSYGSAEGREIMTALAVAGPVVALVSVGLFAIAIGVLAHRRNDFELGAQASSRGIGYVMLVGASLAVQRWMLEDVRSKGGFVFWVFVLVVAALWGTALVARLCHNAADSLEREPGLPPARVVTGA